MTLSNSWLSIDARIVYVFVSRHRTHCMVFQELYEKVSEDLCLKTSSLKDIATSNFLSSSITEINL